MQTTMTSTHRYYLCNRPPMYGTMEPGYTSYHSFDYPKHVPEMMGRLEHGWVEYPEKLTCEQVWKWEYVPADKLEFYHYMAWKMADRNSKAAECMIQDYRNAPLEQLKKAESYDNWAYLTLRLMELEHE